jgi:hypothetical protein
MNDIEINKILTQKEKEIKKNIRLSISYGFPSYLNLLRSRCITLDDVYQEVMIKLWFLLRDVYNERYNLDVFLMFQTSWNAKRFMSNLTRSSSCFFGYGKSPYSGQSNVDNNKDSLDTIISNNVDEKPQVLPKLLWQDFNFDVSSDYEILVEEVIKRLRKKYSNKKFGYKSDYVNIFIYLLTNPEGFSDKNVYNNLSSIFNYKSVDGMKFVLKRIIKTTEEVLKEHGYLKE